MPRFTRILGHIFFGLTLAAGAAWTITALGYHLSGAIYAGAIALVIIGAITAITLRLRARRLGWAAMAALTLIIGGWYASIRPSDDRDWRFDVAHGASATVDGDIVTIANLRDFDWQDANTATQRWDTRSYDLSQLETLDMVTSVWDNPDIAHLLVSFGFADGEHVVWSVEIRKEAHESFSSVGGFFKQFELVLIAATEDDILKLRTNHRQEDVRLYPVDLDAAQRREMFMAFVGMAQDLEQRPQFYNTITDNCTTSVYKLARVLKDDLPIDERLILSGKLPEYLDDLGALKGDMPMADRRAAAAITARAMAADPAIPYSVAIRM